MVMDEFYFYPNMANRIDIDSPMMNRLNNDKGWIAELKYNGWRCLAVKNFDKVFLWTRHRTLINMPLKAIREQLHGLPNGTILDGELLERRTKGTKGMLYLFDIIMDGCEPMFQKTLSERKERLHRTAEKILDDNIFMATPTHIGKKELYRKGIEEEANGDVLTEGIVIKKLSSKYQRNQASCPLNPFWVKVKRVENHITGGKNA
jgi:ATP-dependent DNA ligase